MPQDRHIAVTWYGTASIAVETPQGSVLLDPFIPLRGSAVPRFEAAYRCYEDILITHGHIDHIGSLTQITDGWQRPVRISCTKTPAQTLAGMGARPEQLHVVAPGDTVEVGGIRATAIRGRHIRFDRRLVVRTLLNWRVMRHVGNVPGLYLGNKRCVEAGETIAWLLEVQGLRILALGSLALDPDADYPTGADLLVLPYQGRSDVLTPALSVLDRLQPRAVLLDHFDDTFPPLSRTIGTAPFVAAMAEKYPQIPVTVPEHGRPIEL